MTESGMVKREKPIDTLADLTPSQAQLSSILFNRLQAVTTGTANTMVGVDVDAGQPDS